MPKKKPNTLAGGTSLGGSCTWYDNGILPHLAKKAKRLQPPIDEQIRAGHLTDKGVKAFLRRAIEEACDVT